MSTWEPIEIRSVVLEPTTLSVHPEKNDGVHFCSVNDKSNLYIQSLYDSAGNRILFQLNGDGYGYQLQSWSKNQFHIGVSDAIFYMLWSRFGRDIKPELKWSQVDCGWIVELKQLEDNGTKI